MSPVVDELEDIGRLVNQKSERLSCRPARVGSRRAKLSGIIGTEFCVICSHFFSRQEWEFVQVLDRLDIAGLESPLVKEAPVIGDVMIGLMDDVPEAFFLVSPKLLRRQPLAFPERSAKTKNPHRVGEISYSEINRQWRASVC